MLIVMEGVDGAGKSTLTDRILGQLADDEGHRLHSGPLKGDPMREYEWRLKDYVPDSGKTYVADRWHVGELIYGPLYRGQSKLTRAMQKHVELYLDKLGAHKLVVTAAYDTIVHRLQTRGEDFLQPHHVGLVWDFYNEYAYRNDWTLVGSDEVISHLLKVARKKELAVLPLQKFETYVGPPHPRFLLLGDTHGTPGPGRPAYKSAFVPYPDTSGAFLLDAVEDVGLTDYGIANANQENVLELWHVLGRPKVVALGNEADKAAQCIPHGKAHHPQYVRRFKNGQRKSYGHDIVRGLR